MSNPNKKDVFSWYLEKLEKEDYLKEKTKAERLFDEMITHQLIKDVSKDLFMNERYRNAVLDATIKLEEMIKIKAKFPKDKDGNELSGSRLMFAVFNPTNPILNWCGNTRQTERDELNGYCHIMAGTMLGIRNPKAHSIFKLRPMRALKLLTLVTLLAEIIDASKHVGKN